MLKPKPDEIRKPTKTLSGITPLAVMLPPRKCEHGLCVYCPSLNVPQSYTPKSPVVMRAMRVNYDAYKQVKARLNAFEAMNHPTDKIELIIMGGTFLEYPKKFQYSFIKGLYDGLNIKKSRTLEDAQKLNETSRQRCVALCVETRPDVCSKFIDRMRGWGVTRVELGVQIIDNLIYKNIKRGHKVEDVVKATEDLKNAGFKVGFHVMPGLPGSDFKKDLELFKKLFSDERFKPDQLKLYPCQVIPGSELEKIYWKGGYQPYTKEETEKILLEMFKVVPRYCRVMRVMREIPPDYLVAGTTKIDLRKDIEEELRKKDTQRYTLKNILLNIFTRGKNKIKEIRYREIGFVLRDKRKLDLNLKLKITKYKASKGTEYFLEIINKDDILFGLLRLRIFESDLGSPCSLINKKQLIKNSCVNNIKKSRAKRGNIHQMHAIIREIHVYGQSLKLGEEVEKVGPTGVPREQGKLYKGQQHKGLGKWLMKEAEKITKKNNIDRLLIISGIGVREYYKKLGYVLEGSYMIKDIKVYN